MGSTVSRIVSRKQQEEEEYYPPASEDYVDDYGYEGEQDDKTWLHEKFFNVSSIIFSSKKKSSFSSLQHFF